MEGAKAGPSVAVTIKATADVTAGAPYIKLYLSTVAGDVKTTKAKTKTKKKASFVTFDETLRMTVPPWVDIGQVSSRLQVTVWDKKSSVKANTCCGGFSIAINTIKSGDVAPLGWYKLLSESEGRGTYTTLGDFDFPSYGLSRSNSNESLVSMRSVAQDMVMSAPGMASGSLQVNRGWTLQKGKCCC